MFSVFIIKKMKFIVSVKPKSIIRIKENLEFKENLKKIRKILRYLSLISSIMLRKLRFRQKWFSCKKNLYADYDFDMFRLKIFAA